jgi:hypothetical protein
MIAKKATTRNIEPTIQCRVQKHAPAARKMSVAAMNYKFRHSIRWVCGIYTHLCWLICWPFGGWGIGLVGAVAGSGTGAGLITGGGWYCGTVNIGGGANCAMQGIAEIVKNSNTRLFTVVLHTFLLKSRPVHTLDGKRQGGFL